MENNNLPTNESSEQTPNQEVPLFRKEALEYKKGSFFGKVVFVSPISFFVWSIGLFAMALAIILFISFGSFAKHRKAAGVLMPSKGLTQVYAKAYGTVVECFVRQGEAVKKDQPLYLISTEQHELSSRGMNEKLVESLEKQEQLQQEKLGLYKRNIGKYQQLLRDKDISEIEYQAYYNEYLGAEAALRNIESNLIEVRGRGDHAILAPSDGTVSALVASKGERVTPDKPLASIIPKDAILQGLLFVSPSDMGFIKVGQQVLLKYDAYPYQNFGLYPAQIISIDDSVLSQKDIDTTAPADPAASQADLYGNRTFYRVKVALQQQYVKVYGKPQALNVGMTMVGEIIGEKRKIWQWILNPIYTLKGSLIAS